MQNTEKINELYNLGLQYKKEGKRKEAIECFERCVWLGGGSSAAKSAANLLFNGGNAGEKDIYDAFNYYRYAAELGNAEAMYFVAEFYLKRFTNLQKVKYPPRNEYTGNMWLEKAINAGYYSACSLYVSNLSKGIGGVRNELKIESISRIGAEHGDADSMFNLAVSLENKRDYNGAGYWYNEAAIHGDKEADEHVKKFYTYSSFSKKWKRKYIEFVP